MLFFAFGATLLDCESIFQVQQPAFLSLCVTKDSYIYYFVSVIITLIGKFVSLEC